MECGLNVSGVTCGGPLALGTCSAGNICSEITIYSPGKGRGGGREGINTPSSLVDIDPKEVERKGYEDWLNQIHRFFVSDQVLSEGYQFHAVSESVLEFGLDAVEVELTVSPHWTNPASFYTFLENTKQQHRSK